MNTYEVLANSVRDQFFSNENLTAGACKDQTVATVGRLGPEQPSPRLQAELDRAGVVIRNYEPFHELTPFLGNITWCMGMVWAPFKREIITQCTQLTPTAQRIDVVDTVIRSDGELIGVNTNAAAASGAIHALVGAASVSRALVMGTGASARSTLAALAERPGLEIGVIGRSLEKAQAIVAEIGIGTAIDDAGAFDAGLIINATAVGESTDGELEFSIDGCLVPGKYFFDLNQYVNNLQRDALSAGMNVQSGVLMQRLSHYLRASLF